MFFSFEIMPFLLNSNFEFSFESLFLWWYGCAVLDGLLAYKCSVLYQIYGLDISQLFYTNYPNLSATSRHARMLKFGTDTQ